MRALYRQSGSAHSLVESRATILVLQNEIPHAANVEAAKAVKLAGRSCADQCGAGAIDVIVVNAIEAEMLAGVPVVETLDGALDAVEKLVRLFTEVVVTAGGAGVAYANRRGEK